ncbi:MAG: FGGY-family carbohydrate kinase, partial [Treponema sp.]|nr:FGGY-family carbohydrate kinase [Treponema sp.]
MNGPLVLAFDIGTQSARAMLINPQGEILFKEQKIYDQPYFSKQPGWAEQHPDFYWQHLCEISRALIAKAGSAASWIIAVTCSTIRDSTLCLDKERRPLRDIILWLDNRKTENLPPLPVVLQMVIHIAGIKERVEHQRQKCPSNWLAKNEKEIWDKTDKMVLLSTWLNYKLCGELADATASVIGHLPYDAKNRAWMSPRNIRRWIFCMDEGKQFTLKETTSVLGCISPAAARETGIAKGLPLIASGSDKGCEILGLSCLEEHKAALSFGTTATVELSSRAYMEPLPYFPPYPAVVPGYYNPEVEIYRGYWLLSWFKREFAAKEEMEALRRGISAEVILDQGLRGIKPGCDGLLMQPYFSPVVDMPYAKGSIIGFSDVHTRLHLYRAIIEGINFALMDGMRTMEKRGNLKIRELYVAGGGSRSDEVCRITASMFGLPVYRTQTNEATGIGAALAAFCSMKIFKSWEEGIASMVHVKDCFEPDEHI